MVLTRRDFLAGVLGSTAAAAACQRAPAQRRFSGSLLGQSVELGHSLLRALPGGPVESKQTQVLIAGGGVAGLTAAWRLSRAGFEDYSVHELEPHLGGTSHSGPSFPWGAHYIPAPAASNHSLVALLDELGLIEGREPDGRLRFPEESLCSSPQERLFSLLRSIS